MQLKVTFNFDADPIKGAKDTSIFFSRLVLWKVLGENEGSMVVKRTEFNPPPATPLEKGQPAPPAPPVGRPLPSPDEAPGSPPDPLSSAFTTDQVPRAPISSPPPPPVVARNNPFGPEFFAEIDDPPAPPNPATTQALADPLFSGGAIAHLEAADVTRLLGYLRQD